MFILLQIISVTHMTYWIAESIASIKNYPPIHPLIVCWILPSTNRVGQRLAKIQNKADSSHDTNRVTQLKHKPIIKN